MHALFQCFHGEAGDVTHIEKREYDLWFMDGTVLHGTTDN